MPILRSVDLSKLAMPCMMYALLRTGVTITDSIMHDFQLHFHELPNDTLPEVGDILMWEKDRYKFSYAALKIIHEKIITIPIENNFHVGVMEKDSLVSDVNVNGDNIPFIRYRYLQHIPVPAKIFRKNN